MSTVTQTELNPFEQEVVEVRKELPAEMVALWHELQTLLMIKKRNDAKEKDIRAKLGSFLGDDVIGTIDGQDTVKYAATEGMAWKQFQAKYPETFEAFTKQVIKFELDIPRLREELPDMFKRFQTKSLKPVGSRTP